MVFKQVGNDTDKLINKFGILNKSFANIKKDFQNGQGLRSFGNIVSKQDIANFEKFNSEIKSGVSFHKAFNNNLTNSHTYIQQQAVRLRELNIQQKLLGRQLKTNKISQEEYNASMTANKAQITALTTKTQALTLAQKASAVASKAAVVALNMLGNIAIMAGINLIITGITKLVNKQKELRESISETAKEAKEQTDNLNGLISSYEEFAGKISYTAEEKEKLKDIQEQLSDLYHKEVDDIDLVNGKYDEEIAKLKELKKEKLQDAELSLVAEREQAAKDSSSKGLRESGEKSSMLLSSDWFKSEDDYNNIIKEFREKLKDGFSTDIAWASKWVGYDSELRFYGDAEDRVKKIQEAMSILKDYGYTNIGLYSELNKLLSEYQGYVDTESEAVSNLAENMFQQYELDNPYKEVGQDSYIAWRDGLLATAEDDGDLRKQLLILAEKQFPDYSKYFTNLSKARSMFVRANSASEAAWAKEKDAFLESLSPEDLEIATQIPDLFADGLDGATAKIEAWKADPNNKITPEVDTKSLEDLQEAYDELFKSASNYTKNQKSITSAFEEQEKYGQLSASTIQELTEAGYAQALVVDSETGAVTLNKQAYEQLNKEKKRAIILEGEQQKSELATKLQEEKKAIEELGKEYADANEERKKAILLEMEEHGASYNDIQARITSINKSLASLDAPTFDDGKEDKPQSVIDFEKEYARRQHEINMGRMKEDEDYYKWLESAAKTAFEGLEDYEDDLWKYEEEVYKGRKQLAEDYFNEQQKLFEDRVSNLETQIEITTKTSESSDGTKLNTKEKYDDIRNGYQEIINIIEERINEIVQAGVEGHEEILAELEKQIEEYQEKLSDVFKSAVEEEQDYIEKQKDTFSDAYDERIDKIKKEKEAAEEAAQAEIDALEEKINALKKANEKAEEANDIEEARQRLENAKNQRTIATVSANGAISYQADPEAVQKAQEELDNALFEQQINLLEDQKDVLEATKKKQSEAYDDIIENLTSQKEEGERQFDILLKALDEYLNPDKSTSNVDVWSELAKMQGAQYKNGVWTDKDGNVIDLSALKKASQTETDAEKNVGNNSSDNKNNTNGTELGRIERRSFDSENETELSTESKTISETESTLDKLLANWEKMFDLEKGSLTIEKVQQVLINSPTMKYNPYGAMSERMNKVYRNEYVSNVNNNNSDSNVTFSGDIYINNPVANSYDLAEDIIKNLPNAVAKQIHKKNQ